MERNHIIIIAIIIVIAILGYCVFTALTTTPKNVLEVSDINIEQDQFGLYNLKGHITPKKDFDYIEARIVFYDSNGVVIGKSSCAWNIRSAKSGEILSLGNSLGAVCDGNPAYAVVSFYDSVYSDDDLINATIKFGNGTVNATVSNATLSSEQPASTSSNSPTQNTSTEGTYGGFTKEEAIYRQGLADGHKQAEEALSNNYETTVDNSNHESTDSASSNVETTTAPSQDVDAQHDESAYVESSSSEEST